MVVYCKVPYGSIARWCDDQGYTEVPIADYKPSSKPLLIVDNRIDMSCHKESTDKFGKAKEYIEQAKGRNIYFGLRANAIDYIGSESLVVWSKK